MVGQLLYVPKHPLDKLSCGFWFIQRNVVGDRVQVAECRLSPDYLSHRAMRCFACE